MIWTSAPFSMGSVEMKSTPPAEKLSVRASSAGCSGMRHAGHADLFRDAREAAAIGGEAAAHVTRSLRR